ncbi:MAG: hypothetical protein J2P41_06925, partial [Blastocatellia bacterium]|nr:hypothetical protein [Blastocatellia bacterium]
RLAARTGDTACRKSTGPGHKTSIDDNLPPMFTRFDDVLKQILPFIAPVLKKQRITNTWWLRASMQMVGERGGRDLAAEPSNEIS